MKQIYNGNYELIAEGDDAVEMCNNCPYHEITAEGKHICQIDNQPIDSITECELH